MNYIRIYQLGLTHQDFFSLLSTLLSSNDLTHFVRERAPLHFLHEHGAWRVTPCDLRLSKLQKCHFNSDVCLMFTDSFHILKRKEGKPTFVFPKAIRDK